MVSSYISLDSSSDSEHTEGSASDIDYDMEVEGSSHSSDQEDEDEPEEAYADEPLADDEWLTLYAKEMEMERKLEKKL